MVHSHDAGRTYVGGVVSLRHGKRIVGGVGEQENLTRFNGFVQKEQGQMSYHSFGECLRANV